jgi:acetoin utilization deacetylase AcuC-like enzyme
MTTLLLTHPSALNHATPLGHPERADRIRALNEEFGREVYSMLAREEAPQAPLEAVGLAHPMEYAEKLHEVVPAEGAVRVDGDTVLSAKSWEPIMRAVGGGMYAVDEIFAGKAKNAFVMMRPPGHHAETATPMGFCFFNNAAIAARHAQKKHGAERVAIIDFDVHHGNGTQDIFWNDPTVLYSSTHQMPLYPGTGAKNETGAQNTIVNAPLSSGDGGTQFREAFESVILPRVNNFKPDLVVISAGFDAHRNDPLANLNLVEEDFSWVTSKLMDLADKHAKGRVVSLLEGGYDLEGLARSAGAHVRALMRA